MFWTIKSFKMKGHIANLKRMGSSNSGYKASNIFGLKKKLSKMHLSRGVLTTSGFMPNEIIEIKDRSPVGR